MTLRGLFRRGQAPSVAERAPSVAERVAPFARVADVPAAVPNGPGDGCCVFCLATSRVRTQARTSWGMDRCEDRQTCTADMLGQFG